MTFHTTDLSIADTQYYLQYMVGPRPICFASTIDRNGNVNLSPFSFYNLFSANPPVVIFSPSRRLRDNSVKHTLENVLEVPEVVINVVTYDMVQQASLASGDFPRGTDEFVMSGFSKEKASLVSPPMVRESVAKLECRVIEIKSLGQNGGAGQLVIAEVLCFHIRDELLTADKRFLQEKFDLVGRLGGDWYARISAANLFQLEKPGIRPGIGMNALPADIRNSHVFTGNHLAQLASVPDLPLPEPDFYDPEFDRAKIYTKEELYAYAKLLLDTGKTAQAWQVIFEARNIHNTDV